MTIRRAGKFFSPAEKEFCFNPLWRHIGKPFTHSVIADLDTADHRRRLYVEERVSDEGIGDAGLFDYIDDCQGRLLLLIGPAGVGKTTFLLHALFDGQERRQRPSMQVVWIDVLTAILDRRPEPLVLELERAISAELRAWIAQDTQRSRRWDHFLLGNIPDVAGRVALLREELLETGHLRGESRDQLSAILGSFEQTATGLLTLIRLGLLFMRTEKVAPLVVIDNIDQLPVECIRALVPLGRAISYGVEQRRQGAEGACFPTVMPIRPFSLSSVQAGTGYVQYALLKPPVIAKVLLRRLDDFLAGWDGRIVPGDVVIEDSGRKHDILDVLGDDLVNDQSTPVGKQLVRQMAELVTSKTPAFESTVALVHQLTNFNTRNTLLAAANYAASGHLDWYALAQDLRRRTNRLSWRKVFRAMLLGTRSIYTTKDSWPCNLFDDGRDDSVSVLIRPRLLKILKEAPPSEGLPLILIKDHMQRLFGYNSARVREVCMQLHSVGLLDDTENLRFKLSEAGHLYLQTIITEFEYLQHVLVDTPVDSRYLVPCLSREEAAHVRFERVLRFTEYLRELEMEDLRHARTAGELDLWKDDLGQETFCEILFYTLKSVINYLPREETQRQRRDEILQSIEQLDGRVSFQALLDEMDHETASVSDPNITV